MGWLKWVAASGAVIGLLWGGYTTLDGRYARAADVRQQVDGLKALYLQQRVSDLEREEFSFRREAERRRLTEIELQRLNRVRTELQFLRQQLAPVKP